MKRQPVPKFKNKRFGCKCLKGKCPNYKAIECGAEGGERIREEFGYDCIVSDLKKSLNNDDNVGEENYYIRVRKDRIQEKKNGKRKQ